MIVDDDVRHWLAEHRRVRATPESAGVRSCRSYGRTDAARWRRRTSGARSRSRSWSWERKPAREEDRIAPGFARASRARSEGGVRATTREVCVRRARVERHGRGAPSAA